MSLKKKQLVIVGRTTVVSSSANEAMQQAREDQPLDMGTRQGRHQSSLRALAKLASKARRGL